MKMLKVGKYGGRIARPNKGREKRKLNFWGGVWVGGSNKQNGFMEVGKERDEVVALSSHHSQPLSFNSKHLMVKLYNGSKQTFISWGSTTFAPK